MLMGLAALAKPVIYVLITDKWAASIPYLVVICFSMMWRPIHVLNLNLLQVKGRSDLFLRLEIIKKILSLVVILVTMHYGVFAMCIGSVIMSYISLYINTFYTGKLIHVGFFQQMMDLLPSLLYSMSMGALVYFVTLMIPNMAVQLLVGVFVGILYYFGISYLFKSSELVYIKQLLIHHVLRKYGKK
jgi:O-antigen/teichoic acid export membrane protein